jgi:hypothetical protein
MKKINERTITKNFLCALNEISRSNNVCTVCNTFPCACKNSIDLDTEDDYPIDGVSYNELDPNNDGYITQEDLFGHFDLDNDGTVTTDEYVDHISYHADNPETLDHYREDVPCNDSYNTCKAYYDNDHGALRTCVENSGATCMQSGIQAIIDVLNSLRNSGII